MSRSGLSTWHATGTESRAAASPNHTVLSCSFCFRPGSEWGRVGQNAALHGRSAMRPSRLAGLLHVLNLGFSVQYPKSILPVIKTKLFYFCFLV